MIQRQHLEMAQRVQRSIFILLGCIVGAAYVGMMVAFHIWTFFELPLLLALLLLVVFVLIHASMVLGVLVDIDQRRR